MSIRFMVTLPEQVRSYLDAECERTGRSRADIIVMHISNSREFVEYGKRRAATTIDQPKTITTVVADNPNPVFIPNLCFHGVNLDHHRCPDCAAANREPTLQETMAQLAEVTRIDPSDACVHGVHVDEHCRECGPNCPTCGNEFPCYECDMKEGKA